MIHPILDDQAYPCSLATVGSDVLVDIVTPYGSPAAYAIFQRPGFAINVLALAFDEEKLIHPIFDDQAQPERGIIGGAAGAGRGGGTEEDVGEAVPVGETVEVGEDEGQGSVVNVASDETPFPDAFMA